MACLYRSRDRYGQNSDAEEIAKWGAKLTKQEAIAFLPYLDADKFDEEK